MILFLTAALAGEPDSEPFLVATAHVGEHNRDARGAAEALNGIRADVVVVTGCSRGSLALETLAVGGYRLLADGRDPTPAGICLVGRVDGDTAVVPAPWTSDCAGPLVVGRFQAGAVPFVVIGGHLPSRLPACGDGGSRAVGVLAGLLGGGRLKSAFGPGQVGDAVVLAGNLNASGRQLAPFLAAGLADAGGPRPPASWYAGPVAFALDHVLAPAAWTVSSVGAFDLPGSSHRGVSASFLPN